MSATTILIVEALIKYGPTFARKVRDIFRTETPTDAQWEELFLAGGKSYTELRQEALDRLAAGTPPKADQ